MSTVTETNVSELNAVPTMPTPSPTGVQAFPGLNPDGTIPKGWKLKKDANGKDIEGQYEPKRERRGGKSAKKKKARPQWARQPGKIMSSETPGFLVKTHAKLKETDFNDVLDYAVWQTWYYNSLLEDANKYVNTVKSMGSTPEERAANQENMKNINMVSDLADKLLGSGNAKALEILRQKFGDLFAKIEVGATS